MVVLSRVCEVVEGYALKRKESQNILLDHCCTFQRHWWGKCLILGFKLGFDKNHFHQSIMGG